MKGLGAATPRTLPTSQMPIHNRGWPPRALGCYLRKQPYPVWQRLLKGNELPSISFSPTSYELEYGYEQPALTTRTGQGQQLRVGSVKDERNLGLWTSFWSRATYPGPSTYFWTVIQERNKYLVWASELWGFVCFCLPSKHSNMTRCTLKRLRLKTGGKYKELLGGTAKGLAGKKSPWEEF